MLSRDIIAAVKKLHKQNTRTFIPGQTQVFDEDELLAGVEAVMDG